MGSVTVPAAEWAAVCAAWAEAGRPGKPKDYLPDYGMAGAAYGSSKPDPEDPATLGCLLGLAREVWEVSHAFLYYDQTRGLWCFALPRGVDEDGEEWVVDAAHGPTEYAALCRAIVAGLRRRSQPVNTT